MGLASTKSAAFACLLAATCGVPAMGQGSFDEGSFETGGGDASPAPSSSGGVGGGLGEGSFDEGSFAEGTGQDVTPQPAETAGGSGNADGFDGGSFESQGVNPADPDGLGPVGGEDFPGTTLPDTPGGNADGGITMPETVVVRPDPNAPPPDGLPAPPSGIDPQIAAFETRDFGVPPQTALRQGQFHAPTPTSLPGATLLTTANLSDAMNRGDVPLVLIDVLGQGYSLPGAFSAPALASPGGFEDATQQQASVWLRQITQGRVDIPIVVFCSDPMCWLSYNAALRAVAAGYTNVYWYRGGLQAWQMAGLPLLPAGF